MAVGLYSFCGLIFGHLMIVSIGQCVKDLEIIAKATDSSDWQSIVMRLPLQGECRIQEGVAEVPNRKR